MDLEHEVAPKGGALGCIACHFGGRDFTQLGYGCSDPGGCPRTP